MTDEQLVQLVTDRVLANLEPRLKRIDALLAVLEANITPARGPRLVSNQPKAT